MTARDAAQLLVLSTGGACMLAAISPWSIPLPFTPVPVTLGVLGVLLLGAALGPWLAALAAVEYLLLGLAGVPCFARFQAGPAAFLGPTGGYLLAYPLAAAASGLLFARLTASTYAVRLGGGLLAGLAGVAFIYLGGATWLPAWLHQDLTLTYLWGIAPFIGIDLLKATVVAAAFAAKK